MESSAGYPDYPVEQDDAPFPCKGCGEVRSPPPFNLPKLVAGVIPDRQTDNAMHDTDLGGR